MRSCRLTLPCLVALAACTGEDLATGPGAVTPGPSFVISDGANAGNAHFYFLPPMVKAPSPTGTFDASLQPEVRVCQWVGGACGATVAIFTMTTGPGSETVRVVPDDQHYIVNWHTGRFSLIAGATYRISVLVGTQELGFADVVPTGTGKAKNAVTGEDIALQDGSTLPIKFRVEHGAVDTDTGDPVLTLSDWEHVMAGSAFTCALTPAGAAWCVGFNAYGKVGTGIDDFIKYHEFQAVTGGHTFASLAGGMQHGCGVKADGSAWCWGENSSGVLGRGTKTYSEPVPAPVAGGHQFASVHGSLYNTCGRTTAGEVYCWGSGDHGMIGNGGFAESLVPVKVSLPAGTQASFLSAHTAHACALTLAGEAWCWGFNDRGQLGRGFAGGDHATPAVAAAGVQFKAIATNNRSTCGLTPAGQVLCWGRNEDGDLGRGFTSSQELTPQPVSGGHSFARIYAGDRYYCALKADGQAFCWGYNSEYATGVGHDDPQVQVPTPVDTDQRFAAMATSHTHACGINASGTLYCWGGNVGHQLGVDDEFYMTWSPIAMTGPVFKTP